MEYFRLLKIDENVYSFVNSNMSKNMANSFNKECRS